MIILIMAETDSDNRPSTDWLTALGASDIFPHTTDELTPEEIKVISEWMNIPLNIDQPIYLQIIEFFKKHFYSPTETVEVVINNTSQQLKVLAGHIREPKNPEKTTEWWISHYTLPNGQEEIHVVAGIPQPLDMPPTGAELWFEKNPSEAHFIARKSSRPAHDSPFIRPWSSPLLAVRETARRVIGQGHDMEIFHIYNAPPFLPSHPGITRR